MTKAIVKAILKFLGIASSAEQKADKPSPTDLRSFYQQFQIDLSDFKFDRDLANER